MAMSPFVESLQVGNWFTYNFGTCLVSAQVRYIFKRKAWLGLKRWREYEVDCWVVVEEPGTCYRFPRNRFTDQELESLVPLLRLPIREDGVLGDRFQLTAQDLIDWWHEVKE